MMNKKLILGLVCLVGAAAALAYDVKFNYVDWRTADRSSSGLAPLPKAEKEAVVQIYAARTYNWRKYFAVHSWIATKEKNAPAYTIYQVLGFKLWRSGNAVEIKKDIPDRKWYGASPELLYDLRGEAAERAIPAIQKAAEAYPYAGEYVVFPGPNSNTFIAYIIRNVPELVCELPPTALGKDFLGYDRYWAKSESKTGYQFSIRGLFGFTAGLDEGIELNIAGLVFGIDFLRPALKLPFIGRIGMKEA